MKAQTLALENKLALLEAAIKALPNYTEKMAALETALKTIAANIKAQEGQYADELAALKTSIDAIKSEVAAGNTSQDAALAEIIALLESGAIAGGGSGSGSGGEGSGGEGEGGEGSGDDPIGPYISLTTKKPKNSTITFACYESELKSMSGVADLEKIDSWDDVPLYQGILTSQEVKLYGTFTKFQCVGGALTEIDTQTQGALEVINLANNSDLKFNFTINTSLKEIDIRGKSLSEEELSDLVDQLPPRSGGVCIVTCDIPMHDIKVYSNKALDKGWTLYLAGAA
jgi:hypothetical protein